MCEWIGKFSMVRMPLIFKLISKFNAVSIKTHKDFFFVDIAKVFFIKFL